ncbi:MAG TPA: hypothetical protein VHN99_07340, partial [Deinococcales bacterium]|nr:hypothetical protein [Deinococcales bacterium]
MPVHGRQDRLAPVLVRGGGRLGSHDRRQPGARVVRHQGHAGLQLAFQAVRAGQVGLVHDQHVRHLHHPGLRGLHAVPR